MASLLRRVVTSLGNTLEGDGSGEGEKGGTTGGAGNGGEEVNPLAEDDVATTRNIVGGKVSSLSMPPFRTTTPHNVKKELFLPRRSDLRVVAKAISDRMREVTVGITSGAPLPRLTRTWVARQWLLRSRPAPWCEDNLHKDDGGHSRSAGEEEMQATTTKEPSSVPDLSHPPPWPPPPLLSDRPGWTKATWSNLARYPSSGAFTKYAEALVTAGRFREALRAAEIAWEVRKDGDFGCDHRGSGSFPTLHTIFLGTFLKIWSKLGLGTEESALGLEYVERQGVERKWLLACADVRSARCGARCNPEVKSMPLHIRSWDGNSRAKDLIRLHKRRSSCRILEEEEMLQIKTEEQEEQRTKEDPVLRRGQNKSGYVDQKKENTSGSDDGHVMTPRQLPLELHDGCSARFWAENHVGKEELKTGGGGVRRAPETYQRHAELVGKVPFAPVTNHCGDPDPERDCFVAAELRSFQVLRSPPEKSVLRLSSIARPSKSTLNASGYDRPCRGLENSRDSVDREQSRRPAVKRVPKSEEAKPALSPPSAPSSEVIDAMPPKTSPSRQPARSRLLEHSALLVEVTDERNPYHFWFNMDLLCVFLALAPGRRQESAAGLAAPAILNSADRGTSASSWRKQGRWRWTLLVLLAPLENLLATRTREIMAALAAAVGTEFWTSKDLMAAGEGYEELQFQHGLGLLRPGGPGGEFAQPLAQFEIWEVRKRPFPSMIWLTRAVLTGLGVSSRPADAGTVLLVQRAKAAKGEPGFRRLVNAGGGGLAPIAEQLCAEGLDVELSVPQFGMPLREQARSNARAAVLVAVPGAHGANQAWMRPGSWVIEITLRHGSCSEFPGKREETCLPYGPFGGASQANGARLHGLEYRYLDAVYVERPGGPEMLGRHWVFAAVTEVWVDAEALAALAAEAHRNATRKASAEKQERTWAGLAALGYGVQGLAFPSSSYCSGFSRSSSNNNCPSLDDVVVDAKKSLWVDEIDKEEVEDRQGSSGGRSSSYSYSSTFSASEHDTLLSPGTPTTTSFWYERLYEDTNLTCALDPVAGMCVKHDPKKGAPDTDANLRGFRAEKCEAALLWRADRLGEEACLVECSHTGPRCKFVSYLGGLSSSNLGHTCWIYSRCGVPLREAPLGSGTTWRRREKEDEP